MHPKQYQQVVETWLAYHANSRFVRWLLLLLLVLTALIAVLELILRREPESRLLRHFFIAILSIIAAAPLLQFLPFLLIVFELKSV